MAAFELVSAEWLAQHAGAAGVVVIDSRPQADYWEGHIPHARHLDPALLALQRTDGPALARFHALLGWALSALGITADTHVVVAGAQNEVNAARAAWALAYAGVARIALLDGGLKTWHGETERSAPAVRATRFVPQPQAAYLATAEAVLAASQGGARVLDAREHDEYAGLRSNARRHGRVPGARFWDTRQELGADGRFAPRAQLAAALGAVAAPGERTIVYCGGGGRAARAFVALQLTGHADTAVYPASWNEWGNLDPYPVDSAAPAAPATETGA
ncbi:sulfurtransferase, partial [Cupriavidus sp. WS]|uniref:sulfurtransferase n=1 Tax=Cupriavidus sp. WS TaxID=1312922 RepID=UPI00037A6D15